MSGYTVKSILKECFENGTSDEEIIERYLHGIPNDVARVTQITKWIMLILASIATIITILFITAVIKAIKNHKISRKCYILILNRSFGDFITSFSFVILCILRLCFKKNFTSTQLLILQIFYYIINAALWSEMISYNLLSGIKLYAIAKPFHYRNKFTMKRCIYLASLSWAIFLIIFIIHIAMYIVCGRKTCGTLPGPIEDAISTGIYCFTVIFFVLIAICVYRSRKSTFQEDDRTNNKKSKFPFSTFAVMFGVFIFFYSFLIAADIYFSFIYPHQSFCYITLKEASITAVQESVWILMMIRVIIDPIINCFIDKRLNALIKTLFGIQQTVSDFPIKPRQKPGRNNKNNSGHSAETAISSNISSKNSHNAKNASTSIAKNKSADSS